MFIAVQFNCKWWKWQSWSIVKTNIWEWKLRVQKSFNSNKFISGFHTRQNLSDKFFFFGFGFFWLPSRIRKPSASTTSRGPRRRFRLHLVGAMVNLKVKTETLGTELSTFVPPVETRISRPRNCRHWPKVCNSSKFISLNFELLKWLFENILFKQSVLQR
jgi:hypothetical protein